MGEIKIKKRKENYTFVEDTLDLKRRVDTAGELNKSSDNHETRRKDNQQDYKLRIKSAKLDEMKHKSKTTTGGHNMQGHSPVYE